MSLVLTRGYTKFKQCGKFRILSKEFNRPMSNYVKKKVSVRDEDIVSSSEELSHIPVMTKEVISALQPRDGQVFMDMTFGAGGHSEAIINAASVKLVCLDRDPVAYDKALKFARTYDGLVTPVLGRFSEMEKVLPEAGVQKNTLDGILIDAGCSSMQMDCGSRGFSISKEGPLDMRMDGKRYPNEPTAADILNTLDVPNLVKIFKVYGEEKLAKKIAQALFDARYMLKSINTTFELADLVKSTLGSDKRKDKIQRPVHVATKLFQALRIFVNNELNELNYGMHMAYEYLKPGGRVVTLSFHSLEDRIVKNHFVGIDTDEPISQSLIQRYHNASATHTQEEIEKVYSKKWTPIYKHVIKPTDEEVQSNPRSRSARLRAAVKNKV